MPKRTQIVCLHEGQGGSSIDPIFIRSVLKNLDPVWIRPWRTGVIRFVSCGGRLQVIKRMPIELKACLMYGGDTTLIVSSDLDHDQPDGNALKDLFWQEAQNAGIQRDEFDSVIFIFAKDRLENWIEFLNTGTTDEEREDPRVGNFKEVTEAAKKLATMCKSNSTADLPPSLKWSCINWRSLVDRMNR